MCRLPPLLPDSRHNLVVHCLMDYRLKLAVICFIQIFAAFSDIRLGCSLRESMYALGVIP